MTRVDSKLKRISNSRDHGQGTLYIVSTPIGNLEDITLRAINTLKRVDLIAAEGVQHTRGLCRHYNIKTRLTRYNQHNLKAKGPELLGRLVSGADIALVTNAGTPGVSDPGVLLVHQALEKRIRVSPISGPSAVTAALSVSGMRGDRFIFVGFLPNRPGKRRKTLSGLVSEPHTLVFYEAPHRLHAMLADLLDILGDRPMVLLRELTKVHEEVLPGRVSSLIEDLKDRRIKGEITIVVAGEGGGEKKRGTQIDERIYRRLDVLLGQEKMSVRDIAKRISDEEGLPYRPVYRACLAIKSADGG